MIEAATELGPQNLVTVTTAIAVIGAAVAGSVSAYGIRRDVADLKRAMAELKQGIVPRSTFRLWIAEARDRTKIDLPRLHEIDDTGEHGEEK